MRDGTMRAHYGLLLLAALMLGAVGCSKTEPAAGEAKGEAAKGEAAKGEAAPAKAPEAPVAKAPPTTIPAVFSALSAKHTVAVGGFEGLDGLARAASAMMDDLPPELTAEMKDELPKGFDSIVERMGYDPRDAAAWATVGLDPAAGVAIVVDDRLKPESGEPWLVVMTRVTDAGKLLAALDRIDPAFDLGLPGTDGVAELTTPGGKGLLGVRGGFTAMLPLMGPTAGDAEAIKATRAAFAAWLKGSDPPLAGVEALAPALRLPGDSRSYGVALTGPLLGLMGEAIAPVFAEFYAQRFPALSFSMTSDLKHGGLRILGDAAAVAALRKVLISPHPAPDLDRFAPADGMAVGFSVNPVALFDGVVALIPPERGDVQGQVLIGKNAVPVLVGASLDDLGKALSGHIAVVLAADAMQTVGEKPVVVALGINDPALMDTLLPTVLDKFAGQSGGARKPTKFGALAGHILEGAGPPTFVVRAGDAVLLGPSRAAIEAAVARGAAPGDGPQLDFADGTFYGASVAMALMDTAMKDAPPEAAAMVKAARDFWSDRFGSGFSMSLQVDDLGIRSGGVGATLLVGVSTAIAIPAFVKYINRSKAAQARIELSQLFVKATLARMEQTPLTSAPLTPAADPCAGGDASYEATAATWSHPTWKALGFAPTGKQYYRYAFEPGAGQAFTVRAVGDLDCDGVLAEYVHGTDAEGQRVPDIERNPLE